ncbi:MULTISPECIES: hypothetical protein [Roseobacteraceae]|uniref:hypothetical protein n=1 Tax=Roseobacteraceae TaxID=2854170 RepID=UPI003B8AC944
MTTGDKLPEAIKLALAGEIAPVDLTPEESEIWSVAFAEMMSKPSIESVAFFNDRRARGLGVGLDADGNLVCQRDLYQRGEDA